MNYILTGLDLGQQQKNKNKIDSVFVYIMLRNLTAMVYFTGMYNFQIGFGNFLGKHYVIGYQL